MNSPDSQRLYDELLVTLARTGDRAAFARLAARWQPRLVRTARRLLRDDDLAREVVQESWVAICRGIARLREPERFAAWAFGILYRKSADGLRRTVVARGRSSLLDPDAEGASACPPEDWLSLDQAMARLSADHRATALLYFGEGLTLAEISLALGVPAGTVKSRLFHARKHLQSSLKGDHR